LSEEIVAGKYVELVKRRALLKEDILQKEYYVVMLTRLVSKILQGQVTTLIVTIILAPTEMGCVRGRENRAGELSVVR
jgi:hypothetical protein